MTTITNPTTGTITNTNPDVGTVTAYRFLIGPTAGGPYTITTDDLPLSSLSPGPGAGQWSFNFSQLTVGGNPLVIPEGHDYMVADAKNAAGYSGNSTQADFLVVTQVPAPPTGFSLA